MVVFRCRHSVPDQGYMCSPVVYSPSTNAVLAAVMTGSLESKPVQHQLHTKCAYTGPSLVASMPEQMQQEALQFIKTVPMQHVQSHYAYTGSDKSAFRQGGGGVSSVLQPALGLQPFAQMLRLSSDSSSSSGTS